MLIRWKIEKIVIPLLAVGLLAYMSYRPKFRLRPDMPPAFADVSSSLPSQKRIPEQVIAKAYWECAVTEIQWKYSRTYLPPSPPPDFTIASEAAGPNANDPDTRARYWLKLQEVWYLPNTWDKSYEWDLEWLKDPLVSLRARFQHYIEQLSSF
jgi:hypothetical protein